MTFLECNEKKECGAQGRITPQQALDLKLKISLFAQATAMLEYAKGKAQLDMALAERDRARIDVYNFIDSLTEE